MHRFTLLACLSSLLTLGVSRLVSAPPSNAAPSEAQKVLEEGLEKGKAEKNAAARYRLYQELLDRLLPLVKKNVLVTEDLRKALARAKKAADDTAAAKALHDALRDARQVLTFKPIMEAPLPKGFPELTPVGEIQVKHYPAYRLARTPMEKGQNAAFWTLFEHIKKNNIAMTAPVEMNYGTDRQEKLRSMAFLYRTPEMGKTGTEGNVEIVTIPAMMAVSIGITEMENDKVVKEARRLLTAWLEEHEASYEQAGPCRLLGYNSPFVPAGRRYAEVQIPVRSVRQNIVKTAQAAGQFKTLTAALKAAGLVETLQGKGPFTVFAPTDEAFARLPKGTLAELLKPENKDKLVRILTYHVVAGKLTAAEVVKRCEARTVQGSKVKIEIRDGRLQVNQSRVVRADLLCTNGVIHVIDRVLLPD